MSQLPSFRLAIPKKGRLYEKCSSVLSGAGLEYRREARLDVAVCKDMPVTLVFLPASDIANYVGLGDVDMGITGEDVVAESGVTVKKEMALGFGKCKLCVQAPVRRGVTDVTELAGGRICTSFPELTKKFFAPTDTEKGVETNVRFVSGSVEAACGLGLADAVVDLVETGTTMKAAGLEIVAEVMASEAILISNPNSKQMDIINLIKKRMEGYITATKFMMITYNISKSLLGKASAITPGKTSPTVTPLETEGMCAVSALINKSSSAQKMDELMAIGATDILLFAISNSRM
ncbi:hypothetical protein TrLO_g2859 [Triparma laevis f. longispina]|uniref:ATP phosphoribosyltransferase n=1 Tax=Triparma laevis f. longispina TaxID=1714387 RepID=A0A9W7F8U7_9STRA|nr:hypothetical protein TrLO_g2859 [Triparma laevis f. longispina]